MYNHVIIVLLFWQQETRLVQVPRIWKIWEEFVSYIVLEEAMEVIIQEKLSHIHMFLVG